MTTAIAEGCPNDVVTLVQLPANRKPRAIRTACGVSLTWQLIEPVKVSNFLTEGWLRLNKKAAIGDFRSRPFESHPY